MEQTTESYPHRIRKIAMDLTLAQHIMEMELQATRLREIADELEEWLKQERFEAT
jgi:hypothetical protein